MPAFDACSAIRSHHNSVCKMHENIPIYMKFILKIVFHIRRFPISDTLTDAAVSHQFYFSRHMPNIEWNVYVRFSLIRTHFQRMLRCFHTFFSRVCFCHFTSKNIPDLLFYYMLRHFYFATQLCRWVLNWKCVAGRMQKKNRRSSNMLSRLIGGT